MGDDLSLLVTLDFEAQPLLPCVTVGFGIETAAGLRVLSVGSLQEGVEIPTEKGRTVIRCDLGQIPLNQGQYTIRVVLGNGSAHVIEIHQTLGVLQVLQADIFGTGMLLSASQGFFFWRSDWRTEPLPDGKPNQPANASHSYSC